MQNLPLPLQGRDKPSAENTLIVMFSFVSKTKNKRKKIEMTHNHLIVIHGEQSSTSLLLWSTVFAFNDLTTKIAEVLEESWILRSRSLYYQTKKKFHTVPKHNLVNLWPASSRNSNQVCRSSPCSSIPVADYAKNLNAQQSDHEQ